MIKLVVNAAAGTVDDGGTSRAAALERFVRGAGGAVVEVQNEFYRRRRLNHVLRYINIFKEVVSGRPRSVVLTYPSLPFLWNLGQYRSLLQSLYFLLALRLIAAIKRFEIIMDISDLPLYQHKQLGYRVDINLRVLKAFDSLCFRLAHRVWFPAEPLADVAAQELGVAQRKSLVVVNGNVRERAEEGVWPRPDSPRSGLDFVYAGDLRRDRGIEQLIEAFSQVSPERARLSVCGVNGEWLAARSHVFNAGVLTPDQCNDFLSRADVGIIPYPPVGYYNLIFPTKLSLYVTCRVPILTTPIAETARIVRELGIGFVGDYEDLAAAIDYICDNAHLLADCRKALKRIHQQYYWDTIFTAAMSRSYDSGLPVVSGGEAYR